MKNKIYILTFQNVLNYGAFIQVYALQKILQKKYKVLIINYKNLRTIFVEIYSLFKIKYLVKSWYLIKQYFLFFNFRKKLQLTKFFINKKIKINNSKIIFGSDEIWNIKNKSVGKDDFYFGNINGKKLTKISYAPSFGTTKLYEINDKIKKNLKSFSRISVRDVHSKKIIKKILDVNTDILLDPVFLYSFRDELKKIKKSKIKYKKYLLFYGYNISKKDIKKIKNYAHRKNLKILSIVYYQNWADYNECLINPFEFIYYFKNSYIVSTNMFHGLVLSLKFYKNLILIKDEYRINKISYLKKIFNLKFYSKTSNVNFLNKKNISPRMSKEKNKSLNFLRSI